MLFFYTIIRHLNASIRLIAYFIDVDYFLVFPHFLHQKSITLFVKYRQILRLIFTPEIQGSGTQFPL